MPVRRRTGKRRSTEGLEQWMFVFSSGFDYFRELEEIGIDLDHRGRPSREDAEAAWRRLGEAFMEIPRHPDHGEPWALKQFGEPENNRRRCRR